MPSRQLVRPWAVHALPLRFFYPRTASPGLSPVVFRPFQTSRLHLPAPLRSTGITRLQRYYECSDSCAWMCVWLTQPGTHPLRSAAQVSSLHVPHLPGSPSPTTSPPPPIALSPVLSASWAARLSRVWASPFHRRLTSRHGRIEFVFLRIARSPSVAPHPTSRQRSYGQLQDGNRYSSSGLAPLRCGTLANARCPGQARP